MSSQPVDQVLLSLRHLGDSGDAINSGDYATAYSVLSPSEQDRVRFDEFANGNQTSFLVTFDLDSVAATATGDRVEVRFTSVQRSSMGYHGQTCRSPAPC